MNNIFRVQRYKHIAAAKPARQKKVAEQSGNIIRRMIDIRSKLARSESMRNTHISFCNLTLFICGRSS